MQGNFSVTPESIAGLAVVNVSGELDQATAPELRGMLDDAIENGDAPVVVDLAGCEFIDSTGLSLLVEAQRRLSEDGRAFAVCCSRTEVSRLLELTGIDAAVGLFESRDEAISSIGGPHGTS